MKLCLKKKERKKGKNESREGERGGREGGWKAAIVSSDTELKQPIDTQRQL